MNVGDTRPVVMDGIVVGHAILEHMEDGKATLVIPQTRFIMGYESTLVDIEHTPETDRILSSEVERTTDEDKEKAVVAEQKAGESGSGNSTGPHTHFETGDVGEGLANVPLDSSALDD